MSEHAGERYLVEAIRNGDPAAWREVIDRYQGRLLSFARRRVASGADADDLVQEAFVGLLRSLPRYDPERSLETYLFAILRNKLTDHFQQAGRARKQSLDNLDPAEQPADWVESETPSRRMEEQEALGEQRGALVSALRGWAEQCCEQRRFDDLIVVEMLVVLGLRNKEVATDLGMTETAVAGVKFRVLDQWRKLTQASPAARDWQEADLARDSSVARIWQSEGVSCPKRSTLGRHLLGALDADWVRFVDFHVTTAACDRCIANLDDLRSEDQRDEATRSALRERCFASSVGFLSRAPGS
ncbi:MAG: sigma-70 family RNA polymerase sigma factor [Planctomycetia bacterium]|nr:MAG: sigma-70 family RNA polymerase sigma factor [Planctomycetia bacterium]